MTVPSETNKSGPYLGNGSTKVFGYGFRIVSENHIRVIKTSMTGDEADLAITTDYTVSGVGSSGGGSVTLLVAPASGEKVTLVRSVPFVQETDLENQGAYYAETVEDTFDLGVMRDQQLKEAVDRAVKVPASYSVDDLNNLIADIIRLADSADAVDTVYENIDDVNTVAANVSDVNTVAANIEGVIAASGSVLSLESATVTAIAAQTEFTLPDTVISPNNALIWVGGVRQVPVDDYTVSGNILTLSAAPGSGVDVDMLTIGAASMQDVETLRDGAAIYAAAAYVSAETAGLYDGPRFDSFADFISYPAIIEAGAQVLIPSIGATYTALPIVATSGTLGRASAAGQHFDVVASVETNILVFGADTTGAVDATAAFAAANAVGVSCEVPRGKYRIDGAIPLSTGMKFFGRRSGDASSPSGAVLLQYGQKLVAADEDLRWATFEGFSIDLQAATKNAYTVAFSLKAHRDCVFRDFYFVRYNLATLMERLPQSATINSIDNVYEDWYAEACTHVCQTIGQDGWGTSFQGDGASTVISTGLAWPEQFNSSVSVFKEGAARSFSQMVLGTDYTVSYPSGLLTITMAVAPTAVERIHVFPSQPRADAATGRQRRPFSNNIWRGIKCNYNFGHAWQDLRWVDAEFYSAIRFHAAADLVRGFVANPSIDRSCEAGDFNSYTDCVMSYLGTADPSTIWGWYLGPGSLQMTGTAIAMDFVWTYGGVNRALNNVTRERVALTGTVATTSGSAVVTGTGTKFRDVLTLVGDSKDKVEINGTVYGISSINSDTSLTLTSNVGVTLSGVSIHRVNAKNGNSYRFGWANMGTSEYSNHRGGVGLSEYGSSTKFVSTVTVPAGSTSVTVPHKLWRAPSLSADDILLTPMSNLAIAGVSRVAWVSNITSTSVQVNLSEAYASGDLNLKLAIGLGPLN